MIENDLLKNTSDDIAQFLYKGEGLNKTAIGDYLGERSGRTWMLSSRLMFSIESQQHVDDPSLRLPRHIFHPCLGDTPILSQTWVISPTLRPSSPVAQDLTSVSDALTHA